MASGSSAAEQDVLYEANDVIGIVTFNRPAARNALTFGMYERLAEICAGVDQASPLRALVLTGAGGRAFAAGTDISQFREFRTAEQGLAYERRMDEVLSALERCPIPTIAAITGACTGGGAAIAIACDLRICDAKLQFGIPIARTLGNCLSAANLSRLSHLIGPARTTEMLFSGRLLGADEAVALGLASERCEDAGQVLERSLELARQLARHAPLTLRATKEGLRRLRVEGAGARDEDLIAMCYTSDDFREGLEAFLAKRAPRWKGR